MLTERSTALLDALRAVLPAWTCVVDGDHVTFRRSDHGPHQPPRTLPSWRHLLDTMTNTCETNGVPRGRLLPLRGLDDADLTFSAVQALDPYLKHGHGHTYSRGFLPQPVIRFTGRRDTDGVLLPGYATSFVNVSIVEPIASIVRHAELVDIWVTVLSTLGIHARHITITGDLSTWHRPPVSGITLFFHLNDHVLGDAVLLWNTNNPTTMATDIGSGLERLRWALSRHTWHQTIYDQFDGATTALDAIRTATLLVGSGIHPAARGPGFAVRRLLRVPDFAAHTIGSTSRMVRRAHEFWSITQSLPLPWPEICRVIENETHTAGHARRIHAGHARNRVISRNTTAFGPTSI